ncbi:MAG: hypothetical protein ABW215_18395 [Kibdelosporangium sp.]
MAAAETLGKAFLSAFETLGDDPEAVGLSAAGYSSVRSWINWQTAQAALVGGGLSAVPGVHHAGVFVDIGVLIRKMAIMTWGIGYKLGADVDGRLDLANTLALWAGAVGRDVLELIVVPLTGTDAGDDGAGSAFAVAVAVAVAGKVAGVGATTAVAALGAKAAAKGAGLITGELAGAIMSHVAPYLGTKVAATFAAKQATGLAPVIGAGAAAGLNVWIMKRLAGSATTYYSAKAKA